MKRLWLLLLAITLCMAAVVIPAYASEAADIITDSTATHEFMNWAELLTLPGVALFVMLVVQYIKAPLDKIGHVPTRLVVYLITFVVMLAATAFTNGLTVENALMAAINAFIAALATMGAYEQLAHNRIALEGIEVMGEIEIADDHDEANNDSGSAAL